MSTSRVITLLVLTILSTSNANQTSSLELGGSTCYKEECYLGNVIADSMLYCGMAAFPPADGRDASMGDTDLIGFWNSGSMSRKSFNLADELTDAVVNEWLDGDKNISFVIVEGRNLKKLFDISATALNEPYINHGQFLHVSQNAKIMYRKASRLTTFTNFEVLCGYCDSKVWKSLEDDYNYHVIIPTDLLDLESSAVSSGGIIVAQVPMGTARPCIQEYVGHIISAAGELQEEHIGLGRIVVESGSSVSGEETERFLIEVKVPASSTVEIALLSVTVVMLVGLLVLGIANIYSGVKQRRSYEQHSIYSSRQELTPGVSKA